MCKFGKNRTGKQGVTGPTGTGAVTILNFNTSNVNIPSSTNITVFASASKSGSVVFNGTVNFQTVAIAVNITITPVINGVTQTALAIVHTSAATVTGVCNAVIPVSGLITILAGNSFALNIQASNYTLTDAVLFTSINYNIQ